MYNYSFTHRKAFLSAFFFLLLYTNIFSSSFSKKKIELLNFGSIIRKEQFVLTSSNKNQFGVINVNKTKEAIFEAAIKTFSSRGYDAATMDDIALSAGVAKGTLYYYFKSKEEIFKFTITEGSGVIKQQLEDSMQKETNPLDKLKVLCRVQLTMVYEHRDFFKVLMSQLWGRELRHLQIREVIEDYIGNVEKHLKEAMEEGIIEKAETSLMAYTFFGNLCATAVYELLNEDKTNLNDIIESSTQYILKGIQN